METPKAKTGHVSSGGPVLGRGRVVERWPDGSARVLVGGERDTVESLFELAYARPAEPGEVRQLATWFYLRMGGLPKEGERFELPKSDRLSSEIRAAVRRRTPAQIKSANQWAARIVKDAITLTDNRRLRIKHQAQAQATTQGPAVKAAFVPKAGGVGLGAKRSGRDRQAVATIASAAASPPVVPVAAARARLRAAIAASAKECGVTSRTVDFSQFGERLGASVSEGEWAALLLDAHDGWRLQEELQRMLEASGLDSWVSDRAERWAANAVIDALAKRGILGANDSLAVVRAELSVLRRGLEQAKRSFPFGQRGATGEWLVDRLLTVEGLPEHSWQRLLAAAPDLELVDDQLAEVLAAEGLDEVVNAVGQIREHMVRGVAERAILRPIEEALHAHLNAAALRLQALSAHPEVAVAEARMLVSLPPAAAAAHLETIGLFDAATAALLGATPDPERRTDELAPRLSALARERLVGLGRLQDAVGGAFKSRNDVVNFVPELARRVVATQALGWAPGDFPFADLEPTNAAQAAILQELDRWDDTEAHLACFALEIAAGAATGGLGWAGIAADIAFRGAESGLEAYQRMLTKQALATAGLALQSEVEAELAQAAVAFAVGKAAGIGARLATEGAVEGVTRAMAKVGREATADTLGSLLQATLEKSIEAGAERLTEQAIDQLREDGSESVVIEASRAMGAALLEREETRLRERWSALAPKRAADFAAVFATYCALYGQELPRILVGGRLGTHFEEFAARIRAKAT
jgi:hypothetical protein